MKRTAGADDAACSKRVRRAAPPPPPDYWQTSAAEEADGALFFTTRYMRRKLEYLLRSCATHPGGCQDLDTLRGARVTEVERIENHVLWARYAARLALQRPSKGGREERSAQIKCDMYEDERFLFHGTQPEFLESIAEEGLKRPQSGNALRFGHGIYFSDESCKAHQYAGYRETEDGGREYCLLYCRVLPGRTLEFKATKQDAQHQFLQGMKQPAPEDPVFRSAMLRRGAVRKASQDYDSIDVEADQRGVARGGAPVQIHRELVMFEESQVRGVPDSEPGLHGDGPRRAGHPPAFGAETAPKSPGAAHPPPRARVKRARALAKCLVRVVWKLLVQPCSSAWLPVTTVHICCGHVCTT